MDINPETLQHNKKQAIEHYSHGHFMEARQICEAFCKHDKSDAEVFCLLGMSFAQLGQFDKAAEHTRNATELSPGYLEAHFHLAQALGQLGNLDEAAQRLEFVIARQPHYPQAFSALAYIKMRSGKFRRALKYYRKAREIDPGNLAAVAGEADMLARLDRAGEALDLIQPYIDSHQEDAEIVNAYVRLTRMRGQSGDAIAYLEKYIHAHELDPDTSLRLYFMLGHLCDEAGKYEDAFRYFTEANQLKGVYFDSWRFRFDTDQQVKRFDRSVLNALPRSECQSDLPVFIVGMPRSGTSLVEQILASHRDVYGAGELDDMRQLTDELSAEKQYGAYKLDIKSMLTSERLTLAAEKYIGKIGKLSPAALRVTDKMPGNYFYLGFIELMFPNARVIHCRRNPLDTCLSCFFQNFSVSHTYAFRLEDLGLYYLEYRKLMEHWKRVLTIPIHEVSYEALVAEPEPVIRSMVEFCGLDWDAACLSHEKSDRIVKTASYQQARRKIYRGSAGRWRHYEKHLVALRRTLGESD